MSAPFDNDRRATGMPCPNPFNGTPHVPHNKPTTQLLPGVRSAIERCADNGGDVQLTLRAHEWAALDAYLKAHP